MKSKSNIKLMGTKINFQPFFYFCCCSVAQWCLTLRPNEMQSTSGFPVLHYPPEFAQIHVCWIRWCHPTILSSVIPFFCLQSVPESGSFPMSQLFASGGQNIGASDSASVLPMNIQGWFPLGLTSLLSLHSKGLSRVFSNTTVSLSFVYGLTLTSIHDYWKNKP